MTGWLMLNQYPPNWADVAQRVKEEAGWRCIRCGHPHDVESGYVLTVHHLDFDKSNCRWWNIPALCQRCHLQIQSKVVMDQGYLWEHSEWFKPYVAGYYAWKFLGLELTRAEVMARLDELLALEARGKCKPQRHRDTERAQSTPPLW